MTNQSVKPQSQPIFVEKIGTWQDCYAVRSPGKLYQITNLSDAHTLHQCLENGDLVPINGSCTVINYLQPTTAQNFFTNTSTSSTPVLLETSSPLILPAGMLRAGDNIDFVSVLVSNIGTTTTNYEYRFGPTRTAADTVIATRGTNALTQTSTLSNHNVLLRVSSGATIDFQATPSVWTTAAINLQENNYVTVWTKSSTVAGIGIGVENIKMSRVIKTNQIA